MHLRMILSLALLPSLWPIAASAADDASSSATRGPQREEFDRLHGEMNALLGTLANLQVKYRTADEEKQAEIKQQWTELIAQGEKLEPKLVEAAEKAYAEAPNADPGLTKFLMRLLGEKDHQDDYEPAAAIGKLLVENKCAETGAINLAGIAAFATADFDAAEKYLNMAEKAGYFKSPPPKAEKLAQLGAYDLANIDYYKQAWAKEKSLREAEAKADDLPRVLLRTSKGDIVLELFENEAPNTVANFIHLVNKGFYTGLSFHRVVAGLAAQGGDPLGTGTGGPRYNIACECYRPDHRLHFQGSLSMAHAGRDTGGSQFFITFLPTKHLDGVHTVFGRVIEGMDVLAKLQRRDPTDTEAPRADKIVEAKVLRSRHHAYVPKKMPQ
jgi:cyclophilin family peptidyl-prolyl cis-trans isomerase